MARKQLFTLGSWHVTMHPATAKQPAYATVALHGTTVEGGFFLHNVRWSETVRVALLPTDTPDYQGQKAVVKRAMAESPNEWEGKP